MGSIKALTMAGIVAIGAIAPAAAADLLPPPPVIEAPVMSSVDTSGWYLRGDVGVGVNTVSKLRQTFNGTDLLGNPYVPPIGTQAMTSMGDSAVLDVGVGYQINNWFRADATIGYHTGFSYKAGYAYPPSTCGFAFPATYCPDIYTGQVSAIHGLVNGYVDLGTWAGLTPYVGAGVGLASIKMTGLTDAGTGYGMAPDQTKLNFAWALMAGVGYNVSDRLKLEMGYRYLNMGSYTSGPIVCSDAQGCGLERHTFNLAAHDFRLGMRWMLGETNAGPIIAANAPIFGGPSRPGPLVRKY